LLEVVESGRRGLGLLRRMLLLLLLGVHADSSAFEEVVVQVGTVFVEMEVEVVLEVVCFWAKGGVRRRGLRVRAVLVFYFCQI
jgi:hypothetical protein